LLQGLSDADARIRRACVLNLGKFKNDDGVANAIRNILVKGDPSYAVENAAMETYAGTGRADALELIKPYLGKPSHRDNTTIAALNALAATRKPEVFDTLLEWARPGHPSACRVAARRGLTVLAARSTLSDEHIHRAVQLFTETLEKEPGERTNVLTSLPGLGKLAAVALPAVEKLATEPSSWQAAAQTAARRLKAFAKPEESKKK
jgi:hypothetical protein